jgi:hypothetical protein
MSFVKDFFLNPDRIRKVMVDKIKNELNIDIPARQAIKASSHEGKEAVLRWLNHYKLLRSFPKEETLKPRSNLADAIIAAGSTISSSLMYPSITVRHTEICDICNAAEGVKVEQENGKVKDRNLKSLPSKLLWLLHPDVVPIFDSQAWNAITVVARLAKKVATPDIQSKKNATLDEYCTFLKLHPLCFGEFYAEIDTFIGGEFSKIFESAHQKNGGAITEEDAKSQYANHITVIDQLLWHLGSEIPLEGCITKRSTKKKTARETPVPHSFSHPH